MSRGNRAFVIVLSLLIVLALGLFVLNKLYLKEDAYAPAMHVAPTTTTVAAAMASRLPGVVYTTDFSSAVATGWSNTHTAETHKPPQRKFLGPFDEKPITFTLDGLPPHQFIHLTFELLTYEPWNGDSGFGRDLWDMRVLDGQPLIHTTFSNCGFFENNNEQSFPDQYPWYPTHPGWTGAAAHQSLGFTTTWNRNGTFGTDSTYDFDITLPHTGATIALQFKSQTKQHQNHPYGFLNFKVETVDHPASASDQQIASWWSDLAGEDASKAYHAVWSLIATGDAATEYIQKHLPPPDHSIPMNIDQTARFEYDSFQYSTPELRQFARAIHVLEVINSPESKKLLADSGYTGTPQGGPPTRWDRTRIPGRP